MNKRWNVIHKDQLLDALRSALTSAAHGAASIYAPPSNSRGYGCKAAGCVRPAYASGYCNAHYIRYRKGADMNAPLRARKRDDLCAQCGEATGAKGGWGLCPKHYRYARYVTVKDALIGAMGGACANCGGVFDRRVFDFHHAGSKAEHPSALLGTKSVARIAAELSGCVLLCANCHRMEHCDELRPSVRDFARP
jgi:hypothetical protein